MNTPKQGDNVRALERSVKILETFSFSTPELSLTEICEATNLPKSTTFRLLETLGNLQLLVQDRKTGLWHLGHKLMQIGAVAQEYNPISTVAEAEMESLAALTKQTCNLYVLQGFERVCVAQKEGRIYIERYSQLGMSYPIYCGCGKLFLAYASDSFRDSFFNEVELVQYTGKTITDKDALIKRCNEIREEGWVYSSGEHAAMTSSVAVPLFDYTEKLAGILAISGASQFFTVESVESFKKELLAAASRISKELGYVH